MPRAPTCSAGSASVVSSGSRAVARARPSKPVTETSSGTRSPSRRAALQAPAARKSSSQTSAVGRGARGRAGLVPRASRAGVHLRARARDRTQLGARDTASSASASASGAYDERPGVHVGGEVDEPAVAESEQMLRQPPYAVGDVEVHVGGGPGLVGVAVQHHQGQVAAADRGERVRRPSRRR